MSSIMYDYLTTKMGALLNFFLLFSRPVVADDVPDGIHCDDQMTYWAAILLFPNAFVSAHA